MADKKTEGKNETFTIIKGPTWNRIIDSLRYSMSPERFAMAAQFTISLGKYTPVEKVIIRSLASAVPDHKSLSFTGVMEINGNDFSQNVAGFYDFETHTGELWKTPSGAPTAS